jgi:hypothetical protein
MSETALAISSTPVHEPEGPSLYDKIRATMGDRTFFPIWKRDKDKFVVLCNKIPAGKSAEEAHAVGMMSGTLMGLVMGALYTGKTFNFVSDEAIDRRYGFARLPPDPELPDVEMMMVLLEGPLFDASEGAPPPRDRDGNALGAQWGELTHPYGVLADWV